MAPAAVGYLNLKTEGPFSENLYHKYLTSVRHRKVHMTSFFFPATFFNFDGVSFLIPPHMMARVFCGREGDLLFSSLLGNNLSTLLPTQSQYRGPQG